MNLFAALTKRLNIGQRFLASVCLFSLLLGVLFYFNLDQLNEKITFARGELGLAGGNCDNAQQGRVNSIERSPPDAILCFLPRISEAALGEYPRFKSSYLHEELVEGFQLGRDELDSVHRYRGDVNRHGIAILLKSLLHLGYFPDGFQVVPEPIKDFLAKQLGLLWDRSGDYRWSGGTRDYHLAQIRAFAGWRFATAADKQELQHWIRREEAAVAITSEKLLDTACRRFRELRIEIPVEAELQRLVNAALNGYFHDLYESISSQMPAEVRSRLDELLLVPAVDSLSTFELLKADADAAGIENMRDEITKLRLLRSIDLPVAPFAGLPIKVLQLLKRRAWNEKASEMREHPDTIRYALLGCFFTLRSWRFWTMSFAWRSR